MIDRLENIQKIAAALAICAILAIMNVYGLGLWFEIEGRSYTHHPNTGAEKDGPYSFEYNYQPTLRLHCGSSARAAPQHRPRRSTR